MKIGNIFTVYYHHSFPDKAVTVHDFIAYYILTLVFGVPLYIYIVTKRKKLKEGACEV